MQKTTASMSVSMSPLLNFTARCYGRNSEISGTAFAHDRSSAAVAVAVTAGFSFSDTMIGVRQTPAICALKSIPDAEFPTITTF